MKMERASRSFDNYHAKQKIDNTLQYKYCYL